MDNTTELIYITDPLCSWCYGFAPEISAIREKFSEVSFRMVMGGLRPYETEKLDPKMQSFIRGHWEHVQKASGQPFDYTLLDEPTDFVYDTEPPARAVLAVRQLKPEAEFEFFKRVQEIFYRDNRDTHLASSYHSILPEGVDQATFDQSFASDELKNAVKNDFKFSVELGIQGFPSLVGRKGDEWFLVTRGYAKANDIIGRLEQVFENN